MIDLPEILTEFEFVNCIKLYAIPEVFHPVMKVRCNCHTTLDSKRNVFKSLIKHLESLQHFIKVETLDKLNKKFDYINENIADFDSVEIRHLSLLLSGLLIDYSCTDCISEQSCWGHENNTNTEPWIKFAMETEF